jgi:hypothetical protein
MAYVRLRIEKYLEGEHLTGGAIVDIRRLDKDPTRKDRVMRATVPMGSASSGNESRVGLAPGKYEFTAILPSGDVLSRVEEVDARAEGVPVVFEMDHSAHEWMSWQHALGNVVGGETMRGIREQDKYVNWRLVDDVEARLFVGSKLPGDSDTLAQVVADHLAHAPDAGRVPISLTVMAHPLQPAQEPPYKVYGIPPSSHFSYEGSAFSRRYVFVSDKSNRQMLCALPYPWRKSNDSEAMVELLVGPDQPLDADEAIARYSAPWSVSTIARDDQVAALLSYFAAGDDSAAEFLAMTALDLLFGKMVNPFAASAGAYVLVDQWLRKRETDPRTVEWFAWIDNLAKCFPWLPDGEILRGWIELAGSSGKPSPETARAAFVEAERRGIPVYTAGVRRLADGLSRISNQDKVDGRKDGAVAGALERVRRLAWSTDPRFPFTTVRLWWDAT